MKNKLRFKYPHKTGEIVRQNMTVATKKWLEEEGFHVEAAAMPCFTIDTQPLRTAGRNRNFKKVAKYVKKRSASSGGVYAEHGPTSGLPNG